MSEKARERYYMQCLTGQTKLLGLRNHGPVSNQQNRQSTTSKVDKQAIEITVSVALPGFMTSTPDLQVVIRSPNDFSKFFYTEGRSCQDRQGLWIRCICMVQGMNSRSISTGSSIRVFHSTMYDLILLMQGSPTTKPLPLIPIVLRLPAFTVHLPSSPLLFSPFQSHLQNIVGSQ